MPLGPDSVEHLLRIDNYREFLKTFFEKSQPRNRKANLADLARKAQFSSRSFVSDVLRGKRRITAATLPRFKLALGVTGAWAHYFDLMVMKEETDLRPARLTTEKIDDGLQAVRKKIRDRFFSEQPIEPERLKGLFNSFQVFDVFAAMGSLEAGADLPQILRRTKLPVEIVTSVLENLVNLGFIERRERRYYTSVQNFDLGQLGDQYSFIKAFQQALEALKQRSLKMENSPDTWFFHTAFSIDRSRISEFNKQLKEFIFDFIDERQIEDGDSVMRVTLGAY